MLDAGRDEDECAGRTANLAVRQEEPVPIFADESVLEEAGVVLESDDEEEQVAQFREFLDQVQPEDFAH